MSMLLGRSSLTLLLNSGGTTFPSPQQDRPSISSPPPSSSSSPSRTMFSYRGCRAAVQTQTQTQTFRHGHGRGYGVVETEKKRPQSLYNVLRVNPDASTVEIKTAYRTLAKLYHPDASSSSSSDQSARSHSPSKDGQDFMRIRTAYVTLSDPSARSLYDMSLGLGVVGVGRRSCRRPSSPFSAASDHRPPPPSAFHRTTRRWETDQCW